MTDSGKMIFDDDAPATTGSTGPALYAAVRETHIGVVFLVGDRAYKCKKPIDPGFVDFRERHSRVLCCHREVALNRRLAPTCT